MNVSQNNLGDAVDLSDKKGPISCQMGGVKIILRRLQRPDLEKIHRLMKAVPWNIHLRDLQDFFSVRPDDMFGAFLLDTPQKLISHCTMTRWGDHHAYLGWYVTDQAYRRRAIGSIVFNWARKCAGDVAVFLDALPGMDVVYARTGFQTIRETYAIKGLALLPATRPSLNKAITVEKLGFENFHLLSEYDKEIYPVDRSALLKTSLISPPVRETKIAVLHEKCVGYLCIRSTENELNTLCPLIADDPNIAERLLYDVIKDHQLEGEFVDIFVPDTNSKASKKLLAKFGITEGNYTLTVMCTQPEVSSSMVVPWHKIYGCLFNNFSAF